MYALEKLTEDLKKATAAASAENRKYLEIIEQASLKLYDKLLSADEFAARIEQEVNTAPVDQVIQFGTSDIDPHNSANCYKNIRVIFESVDGDWDFGTYLSELPVAGDKVVIAHNGEGTFRARQRTYAIVERYWEFDACSQFVVIKLEPIL